LPCPDLPKIKTVRDDPAIGTDEAIASVVRFGKLPAFVTRYRLEHGYNV
jgi:hypothetical protein